VRITAAVTEEKGAPFALRELELGEPRPDELVVEIAAAGICHTDLICRDQWLPVPFPTVFGHEGAGIVKDVGSAVTGISPGDRVSISYNSCGRCRSCLSGKPCYCHAFFEHNFAASRPADGSTALSSNGDPVHAHFFGQSSFATHTVASLRSVVRLEGTMPLEIAAPLGCGIQTGAGSVFNSLRVPAGSSFVVFGAGAVGLTAVMAAVVAGSFTIVAIDLRPNRLDLALELGATHTVDAGKEDPVEAVRRITGAGADYCLEASGSTTALRQAVDCLTPMGVCGVVGAPPFGAEASFDVNFVLSGGRTIRGIVEGDAVPQLFLPQLVGLWEQGRFPIERIMAFYDFDQIEQAAHDAETGDVIKPVLRMN
jgi:aryl-alcohol dehydrogenase